MHGKKLNFHRVVSFFVCLGMLLTAFSALAAEQPKEKIVRVGWYEDLFNNISVNGERSGYAYEYEQSVASYTGWSYLYVRAGWATLLQMLQEDKLDLLAGVSYTDERAQKMLFSDLPMGVEKYYLYAGLDHSGISASDMNTLNGKRIAILSHSVQIPQFNAWKTKHNLDIQNVYILNLDDLKHKLANHEVDGIISTESKYWAESGLSAIATTGNSGIYFVINKNRPDLKAELDTAMRKMEYDKPFFADDLYKRYYSLATTAVLADEEKDWLAKHGSIRIGYLKNDGGFSSFDKNTGKLVGVINDYVKFAQDCLGKQALKFELVGFESQHEEMQALRDKKIDVIFHFSNNKFAAERNEFILSNTVLTLPLAVFTGQEYFDENAENKVAIEKNNYLLKWHIAANYPKWRFMEYVSADEVQEAVENGAADCVVTDSRNLAIYSDNEKLHGVFLTQPGSSAFAVNRDNTMLLSILNKTLKTMSPSMLTSALSMYNSAAKKTTLKDFVMEHRAAVTVTLLGVVIILLLLRKAKIAEAKAKRADEAKTAFLFNMSHDIRTPMNALLGYSKLMKEGLDDPKLLDYQAKMEQSGNLLLSIINNVLDMARIESGKVEIEETYSKVGDILTDVRGVFAVEAEKKQIKIIYEANVQTKYIMCDVTKLKEIYSNLVSNAIKYTPQGGTITLCSQELASQRTGYIRIVTEVIDTGIGMSKEYLPHLFDAFSRERNTTTGKVAGTGLGMSIVKKLVEMMHGTIEVESELGKGSKFTVTLEHRVAEEAYYEQQKEAAAVSSAASKELLCGKHLLMAEDNDLNAEIALFILQNMGLVVDRVVNGVQCVSKVQEQPAGTYDLILMDIQMPEMDGYKATLAIRRLADKAKASIPIVAMTANAFTEDKANALKAGMNGHIAKPIDVEKVEKTLSALLQ